MWPTLGIISTGHQIPYSGKFLGTINFAVFVDFTSNTKIISSKFCRDKWLIYAIKLTVSHMWYLDMLLYKYFAVKCKVCHPTAAVLLSFSLSSCCHHCSQWRNHLSNGLRKGGNHEEPTVAYHGQITLQSCRALLLSSYTENDNILCKREVWLVSHSQPLFSCRPHGPQEKGAGYSRLSSGHRRLEELQQKVEYAKHSLL